MKPAISLLCAALSAGATLIPFSVAAEGDADRKAIEQTIGYYFTAGDTNDAESLARAFHPDAKMLFMRDGALTAVTQPEWQDRLRKATKVTKANYRKILSIDVTGDAAIAKVESDFDTFQFLDYMSLLKINGEWKIVNKIFYRTDK